MKTLFSMLLGVALIFAVLGVVGCAKQDTNNPEGDGQTGEQAMPSETITGTIDEINGSELMVSVTSSTTPAIVGRVRVNVGQIDNSIVATLAVGDSISFEFSGAMGMSEPPFVSATELEVL